MNFLSGFGVLILALLHLLPQHAAAKDMSIRTREIEAVVDAFQLAIVNRDRAGFLNLFLREDITWIGVYTDASIERHGARKSSGDPDLPKTSSSTPRQFIERMIRSPEPRRETVSNVRIDTDGDVAQVWFDYTMMVSDYRNNWGKESWQLIRTSTGWKITAVTWSSEQNPVPRPTGS